MIFFSLKDLERIVSEGRRRCKCMGNACKPEARRNGATGFEETVGLFESACGGAVGNDQGFVEDVDLVSVDEGGDGGLGDGDILGDYSGAEQRIGLSADDLDLLDGCREPGGIVDGSRPVTCALVIVVRHPSASVMSRCRYMIKFSQ